MSLLSIPGWEGTARKFSEVTGWTVGNTGTGTRASKSGEESARELLYIIRAHYASTDGSNNGEAKCPLYYASIEGIIGNSAMCLADLKGLPVPNPPSDFRMVDVFNCFPMALRADSACILNDFSWDRLVVKVNGENNDELSKLARQIVKESAKRKTWSLSRFMFGGGSRGDCYIRPRPDKSFQTKIRWDLCQAEGVFPRLAAWNTSIAEAYRLVYKVAPDLPADVTMLSPDRIPTQDVVEVLTKDGIQVYVDDKPVDEDENGNRVSGDNPKGLDEPAIAHLAYRESDTFYGIPALDSDTLDLVDVANVAASSCRQVEMSFGQPTLAMEGVSQEDAKNSFAWNRRNVVGIPQGGKMYFVSFENLDQLLEIVQSYPAKIRSKVVQFTLEDLAAGDTGESGIALEYRLFPYSSYLSLLEMQLRDCIGKAVEISLKMLGKWPGGEVEIGLDFGARFPVDVAARLNNTKTQVEVFGRTPELIEELAMREKFSDATVKAIVEKSGKETEASIQAKQTEAFGGGPLGAARAQQAAELALKSREAQKQKRAEEGT